MISVCGECVIDFLEEPGTGSYRPIPGGSPLNIAVGLSRLDVATTLLGRIGTGRMGTLLRDHLTAAGVGADELIAATQPCSLALVSVDPNGTASYDFYVDGAADWQWGPDELPQQLAAGTVALHVGSLAAFRPPGAEAIVALVERERSRGVVTICLDPNIRPRLIGDHDQAVRRIEQLAAAAGVIKVSREDLEWLYPGVDHRDVAERWHAPGGRLVVVTDGASGATAICPDGAVVAVAADTITLVDTVGAGDSFHAALLAGLCEAELLDPARLRTAGRTELEPVLRRACRAAGITCGRAGADPPTRAELDWAT